VFEDIAKDAINAIFKFFNLSPPDISFDLNFVGDAESTVVNAISQVTNLHETLSDLLNIAALTQFTDMISGKIVDNQDQISVSSVTSMNSCDDVSCVTNVVNGILQSTDTAIINFDEKLEDLEAELEDIENLLSFDLNKFSSDVSDMLDSYQVCDAETEIYLDIPQKILDLFGDLESPLPTYPITLNKCDNASFEGMDDFTTAMEETFGAYVNLKQQKLLRRGLLGSTGSDVGIKVPVQLLGMKEKIMKIFFNQLAPNTAAVLEKYSNDARENGLCFFEDTICLKNLDSEYFGLLFLFDGNSGQLNRISFLSPNLWSIVLQPWTNTDYSDQYKRAYKTIFDIAASRSDMRTKMEKMDEDRSEKIQKAQEQKKLMEYMDETFDGFEKLRESGFEHTNCDDVDGSDLMKRYEANKSKKDQIDTSITNKRNSYGKKDQQNEGEIKVRFMKLKSTTSLKEENEILRNDLDDFKNNILTKCAPSTPENNPLNFLFPLEGAVDFGGALDVFNKLKEIMTDLQNGITNMLNTEFTQGHIDYLNEIEFHNIGENIIGSILKATYSKKFTVGFLGTTSWDLSLTIPSLAGPFPFNFGGLDGCTAIEKFENIVADYGGSIMSLLTYFYGKTKVQQPDPQEFRFSLPRTSDSKYERKVLKMYDRSVYEEGFDMLANYPIRYTEKVEIAFGFGQFSSTLYSRDGTSPYGDTSNWEGLNAAWCQSLASGNYVKDVCMDSFAFKFYENCEAIESSD